MKDPVRCRCQRTSQHMATSNNEWNDNHWCAANARWLIGIGGRLSFHWNMTSDSKWPAMECSRRWQHINVCVWNASALSDISRYMREFRVFEIVCAVFVVVGAREIPLCTNINWRHVDGWQRRCASQSCAQLGNSPHTNVRNFVSTLTESKWCGFTTFYITPSNIEGGICCSAAHIHILNTECISFYRFLFSVHHLRIITGRFKCKFCIMMLCWCLSTFHYIIATEAEGISARIFSYPRQHSPIYIGTDRPTHRYTALKIYAWHPEHARAQLTANWDTACDAIRTQQKFLLH